MTKYHMQVLGLYEKIKKENRSDAWQTSLNEENSLKANNSSIINNYDFYSNPDDEYTQEGGDDDEEADDTDYDNQNDFDEYEQKTVPSQNGTVTAKRLRREASISLNEPPGKDLMNRFIYKKLTGQEIYKMLPADLTINNNSKYFLNHAFNKGRVSSSFLLSSI